MLMDRRRSSPTRFPYTTLFRSPQRRRDDHRDRQAEGGEQRGARGRDQRARDLRDVLADRAARAMAADARSESTRLNSSHGYISYAVLCLKKKKNKTNETDPHHD